MGQRGPKPAPTALKLVKGERKSRLNTNEPKLRGDAVVVPDFVTGAALELWHRRAPELVAVGVLKNAQAEAFGQWCVEVVRYIEARERIAETGGEVIVEGVFDRNHDKVGERQARNEWSRVADAAFVASLRMGAQFGLTPTSQAGLKVGDGQGSKAGVGADILTG